MPRTSNKAPKDSTAHLGLEAKLWLAASPMPRIAKAPASPSVPSHLIPPGFAELALAA